MVSASPVIIIIGVVIIAIAALFLLKSGGLGGGNVNDVPTSQTQLAQKVTDVFPSASTQGLLGFVEGKAEVSDSVNDIKANIVSGNLTTENAIRKVANESNNIVQVATETGGSGTQTKSVLPETSILVATENTKLSVAEAFAPAGEGQFQTIRGTPLSKDALVRTQETFSGTLTTPTGGTRDIRGSEGLFKRLQDNLLKSS